MISFDWDNSLISRDRALELYDVVEAITDSDLPFPSAISQELLTKIFVDNQIIKLANNVFTFPWFGPELCQNLCSAFPASAYTPNSEEAYAAQIPEIVLGNTCDSSDAAMEAMFDATARPLVHLLTGQDVSEIASIQLARYEPDDRREGCFHTDQDSDITLTVALNENYLGGGLHVYESFGISGTGPIHVPKQPMGTATLFLGKTSLHKGLAVTQGVKHLLVYWMRT